MTAESEIANNAHGTIFKGILNREALDSKVRFKIT